MKKILLILIALGVVVSLVLVSLPLFLDVERYKNQFIDSIFEMTGIKVEVTGQVELSFFPVPKVRVHGVNVPNSVNASSSNLLTVQTIEAKSSFQGILAGSLDIDTVKVINPVMELERTSDGNASWHMFLRSFNANMASSQIDVPKQIIVQNGYVLFHDNGYRLAFDYINVDMKFGSFYGPYTANGSFELAGSNMGIKLHIGHLKDDDSKLNIDLSSQYVSGSLKGAMQNGILIGNVDTNIHNLGGFVENFFAGSSLLSSVHTTEDLTVSSSIAMSGSGINLRNVSINSPSIKGTGNIESLSSSSKDGNGWDILVDFETINFDTLFEKEEKQEVIDYYASSIQKSILQSFNVDISKKLSALLDISVNNMIYKGQTMHNFALDMDVFGGKVLIHRMEVDAPGQSSLQVIGSIDHNGIRPLMNGSIRASGERFRDVLTWFVPEASFIPEDLLQSFVATCDFELTPQKLDVTDIYASVDRMLLKGKVNLFAASAMPALDVELNVDRFQLDDYALTPFVNDKVMEFVDSAHQYDLENSALRTLGMKSKWNVNFSDLTYNNHKIKQAAFIAQARPGRFDVQRFLISGDKVALNSVARVDLLKKKPFVELSLISTGVDTSAFIIEDDSLDKKNTKLSKDNKKSVWSNKAFTFLGLDRINGRFNIDVKLLKHKEHIFKDVLFSGIVAQKLINFKQAKFDYGKGTIRIPKFAIGLRSVPSLTLSSQVQNINLTKFLDLIGFPDPVKGRFNASMALKTNGSSPYEWIDNMLGQVRIEGKNIEIEGLDLHRIIKGAQKLYSVIDFQEEVEQALKTGKTVFKRISGAFAIDKKGKKSKTMQTTGLQIETRYTSGILASNIDLHSFASNSRAVLAFLPKRNTKVSFGLNVSGPIDNLTRTLDTKELDAYITNKGRR